MWGGAGGRRGIGLSARNLGRGCREGVPEYGGECVVARGCGASWADWGIVGGSGADSGEKAQGAKLTRAGVVVVGRVLETDEATDSRLYAADHRHILRPDG